MNICITSRLEPVLPSPCVTWMSSRLCLNRRWNKSNVMIKAPYTTLSHLYPIGELVLNVSSLCNLGFLKYRVISDGHYVAYCMNSIDGYWYEYDDSCVTRVDEAEVLSREAYVLFYQKKGTETSENFKRKVLEASAELNENDTNAFYISTEWLHRFRTFSEPGPITNTDFLCEHLGQIPFLQPTQVFPIPSKIWQLLHEQYGGGPPCDRLIPCNICLKEKLAPAPK